jgi:hypothetical protein
MTAPSVTTALPCPSWCKGHWRVVEPDGVPDSHLSVAETPLEGGPTILLQLLDVAGCEPFVVLDDHELAPPQRARDLAMALLDAADKVRREVRTPTSDAITAAYEFPEELRQQIRTGPIVCPSWCGVSEDEHRAELDDVFVMQRSAPRAWAAVVAGRRADGVAHVHDEPPVIFVSRVGGWSTPPKRLKNWPRR